MKKLKKPRPVYLYDNFYLVAGCRGQPIFYVMEMKDNRNLNSYHWVCGRRKQKAVLNFVQKLIEWSK